MTNEVTLTLYSYATGEAIRELTPAETAEYLELIKADTTHTGAAPGGRFGFAGTVYAI
jgi:hypothetical protein